MNIQHAVEEKIQGDRLKAIFDRQKELMEKYHDIEARSGLLQTHDCPVNLHDKKGQARLKDFAWRFIEEIGEALDAYHHEEHYHEELIDGLHFLTEFTILSGNDYNTLCGLGDHPDYLSAIYFKDQGVKNLGEALIDVVREMGMCCNCLKNKPWKQSSMLTDVEAFNTRLKNVWAYYMTMLSIAGLSDDDVANVYLKKSQVNKFRQRSNY